MAKLNRHSTLIGSACTSSRMRIEFPSACMRLTEEVFPSNSVLRN